MYKQITLCALAIVSVLFSAGFAYAGSCTNSSTSGCERFMACPSDYSFSGSSSGWCAIKKSTKTPTCGTHSNKTDWKWGSRVGKCYRTRPNGDRVNESSNIRCGKGYSYNSGRKTCVVKSGSKYAVPTLKSTASATSSVLTTCSSSSKCKRKFACSGKYKVTRASSGGHYCRYNPADDTKNPTCAAHNSHNDWKWGSKSKKCYRNRRSGERVSSTTNIRCSSGYTYNSRTGKCQKDGGVKHGVPTRSK